MSEDLYVYPEDLMILPKFQTRTWPCSDPNIETLGCGQLAESIKQNGQIDSGVVILDPEGTGRHVLIIGHRRRRAIALINQEYESKGIPLIKMRVRIDRVGDPLRKAYQSNWNLDNFSPMDKSATIARLRRENGWYHRPGTERIAHYLGVSPATVIQYEKFIKAEPAVQAALHSGQIAPESAFELIKATEVKAAAVLRLAARLEEETTAGVRRGKRDTYPVAGRIRRPSILGAIDRLSNGAKGGKRKTRAEILRFVCELDTKGFENGDRHQFIQCFCMWAEGAATDYHLIELFNTVTAKSNPGHHVEQKKRVGAPKGKPHKMFSPRIPPAIDKNAIEI